MLGRTDGALRRVRGLPSGWSVIETKGRQQPFTVRREELVYFFCSTLAEVKQRVAEEPDA